MEKRYSEIVQSIDAIFVKGTYFYSEYIVGKLKDTYTLEFIEKILQASDKTVAEAIIVLLSAVRYHRKDIFALRHLEQNDRFIEYLKENATELFEIACVGKVQGNAPERALPVLDVLSKKIPQHNIALIELGASYGLIGSCLLNPEILLGQKTSYFKHEQQFPVSGLKIENYLGIDINPPSKEWLIACFANTDDALRVSQYIDALPTQTNFELLKASALGFSKHQSTLDFIAASQQIVVLTSFMLYQLSETDRAALTDEIMNFVKQHNACWLKQEVALFTSGNNHEYYIDWNNQRQVILSDDKCSKWEWVQ